MDLSKLQQQLAEQDSRLPPVEKWNPPFCGNMDIVIKTDGSWWYMGSPIGRKALVKLFASVLKKEHGRYFLVTPVEKVGIQVEDAPFVITQWQQQQDKLLFTSQCDDQLVVSPSHPVQLFEHQGQLLPYALVRRNLWARLHQNIYYQLAELGQPGQLNGQQHLLLSSGDYQFSLGLLEE